MRVPSVTFAPLDAELFLPKHLASSPAIISCEKRGNERIRIVSLKVLRKDSEGERIESVFTIKMLNSLLSSPPHGLVELHDKHSGVMYSIKKKALRKALENLSVDLK